MQTKPSISALLAAALLLAACSPGKPTDSGAASDSPSQQADLSWYMPAAFMAAFGAAAPAPHDIQRDGKSQTLQFSPNLLVDIGQGRLALVSTSAAPPDDCTLCGASVAVHYLQKTADGGFKVAGQWWDLLPPDPLDQPPEVRVRQGLFDRPALQVEVAHRDRGCESAAASLFEFTPQGPVLRARAIPTARNNIPMGAMRVGPQVDLYGNILPDAPGKTFKVRYHGSFEGDATYGRSASGVWAAQGAFNLPVC